MLSSEVTGINFISSKWYTHFYCVIVVVVLLCETELTLATISTSTATPDDDDNNNNNVASSFQRAILYDMFPKSSDRCGGSVYSGNDDVHAGATKYSTIIEHNFTPSTKSNWNSRNAPFERDAFLLQMMHKQQRDDVPNDKEGGETVGENYGRNQEWTIRLSKGGNIYSFVGSFGESVPPQYPPDSPWMDEVWQTVSVNTESGGNKNYPYFIHQAGTYLKDDTLDRSPFYSPSLAVHCERNTCYTASWGQNAHVPTVHTSPAVYMNRYVDCGEGVLEVTSLIHNLSSENVNPKKLPLNWMNVPWGGVRTSTLPDVYMSRKEGGSTLQKPLQNFGGSGNSIPELASTGGYTLFAEPFVDSANDIFELPCGDGSGKQVACGKLPPFSPEKNGTDSSGAQQEQCLDSGPNIGNAASTLSKEACSASCLNQAQTSPKIQRLKLTTSRDNACEASPNHPKRQGITLLHLLLNPTVKIQTGFSDPSKTLLFTNVRTGMSLPVLSIYHWSWNGIHLFFYPLETHVMAKDVNNIFAAGDSISVSYSMEGKTKEESLSLSFVHGTDKGRKEVSDNEWLRAASMIRYGNGSGNTPRDYTVFTVIVPVTINPGETFVKRQYMITNLLKNMDEQSLSWVSEVNQKLYTREELVNDEGGQTVYLFSTLLETTAGGEKSDIGCDQDNNDDVNDCLKVFSAGLHNDISANEEDVGMTSVVVHCKGSTVPMAKNTAALFFIDCGSDNTYVGSDLYRFASKEQPSTTVDDIILRPYVCKIENTEEKEGTTRPSFKLLGYFDEGSCGAIVTGYRYEEGLPVAFKQNEPPHKADLNEHDEL